VVLGGPYVTTTVEELPDADHIFLGEAETTIPQVRRRSGRGEAKRTYQQQSAAAVRHTAGALSTRKYETLQCDVRFNTRAVVLSLRILRHHRDLWPRPRTKSNQQMIAEFDALRDLVWRGTVFIVDDNFIGNKKNVRQLLPEIAKWQKAMVIPFH